MAAVVGGRERTVWRGREVSYQEAGWTELRALLPAFSLAPFSCGEDSPENPWLQTVVRSARADGIQAVPVATVSKSYSLVQHRTVAEMCRGALAAAGVDPAGMRYEVGLTELGEWMHLRIYFPKEYDFTDLHGERLSLRLECTNSVDGTARLVILMGWLRQVCSNGLVIDETRTEVKERHAAGLNLGGVDARVKAIVEAVEDDRVRMEGWQRAQVELLSIVEWVDGPLSEAWGRKAAARVLHACADGRDVRFEDPFAPGPASAKPVELLGRIPGSPERAGCVYDVVQAMAFVAASKANAEERLARLGSIAALAELLIP